MMARHRVQLSELLTCYGTIDMLCLDMWFGPYEPSRDGQRFPVLAKPTPAPVYHPLTTRCIHLLAQCALGDFLQVQMVAP